MRTSIREVNFGQNKFCGPAVLSILTGKSTDECAFTISRINGKYTVTGVTLPDLLKAADKLGFDNISRGLPGNSLYRSLTLLVNDPGMYIVMLPRHFVCIEIKDKQIYFCDNHTKEPIPAASSARLMQKVVAIHKVFKRQPKPLLEPKFKTITYVSCEYCGHTSVSTDTVNHSKDCEYWNRLIENEMIRSIMEDDNG